MPPDVTVVEPSGTYIRVGQPASDVGRYTLILISPAIVELEFQCVTRGVIAHPPDDTRLNLLKVHPVGTGLGCCICLVQQPGIDGQTGLVLGKIIVGVAA